VSGVRELGSETVHYAWDNALPPRLEIDSGEIVRLRCRDAFDGVYSPDSTAVVKRVAKGHPLTGPIAVRGAQPGDVLQVDVLDLVPGAFGVTTFVPDRGLLAGDFPEPYLKVWDLHGDRAELRPGVRVPLAPFLGVMGVALAEPGEHSTIPPRSAGGNMDIKQLTKGSTLYLPVAVAGALFSCGDGHAAQGDGEVCITAIETTMTATLRLGLRRDLHIAGPEFEAASAGALAGRHYVTTGIAPDLMAATKAAVRAMIAHLVSACGLTREEAYVLCSVAADLKISEVVDAPNWVVSAFLPMSLFG
jgi:acetamidase/formamidase